MNLAASFKSIAGAALGFIYPNACQLCGRQRATADEGFVCARCWQQVRFIKPPFCKRCGLPFPGALTAAFECANCREMKLYFRSARSAVIASGAVLEVIHRYKYKRAFWFEPFLADLLLREALPELRDEKWDRLVPVPLHPAKKRQREFNQAERLAAFLSAATKIPMDTTLLQRVTATKTQTKLTREQRAENMRNAFALRSRQNLAGQRILLFDDVFTTGATTNACARVLLAAGAEEVSVWTLARGL
ncbi:MAG TPA: ComF family protein [Verrucomicrobiae bacterium]|nr:ComF family protein [Verrucomicrobiae bacterium]